MTISQKSFAHFIRYALFEDRPIVDKGMVFTVFPTDIGGFGEVEDEFPIDEPADKLAVERIGINRYDDRFKSQA